MGDRFDITMDGRETKASAAQKAAIAARKAEFEEVRAGGPPRPKIGSGDGGAVRKIGDELIRQNQTRTIFCFPAEKQCKPNTKGSKVIIKPNMKKLGQVINSARIALHVGAVAKIYEANTGDEITEVDQFVDQGHYIFSINKRFNPNMVPAEFVVA